MSSSMIEICIAFAIMLLVFIFWIASCVQKKKQVKRAGILYIDYSESTSEDPDIYIQLYEALPDIQKQDSILVNIKVIGKPPVSHD